MDIKKIKKLIKIIEGSNVSKLKISEGKNIISININKNLSFYKNKKNKKTKDLKKLKNIIINDTDKKQNSTQTKNKNKKNHHIIHSPMVGIFYSAPHPNTKPFVEIGQKIDIGDTLCIVEAMKIMNHIQSDIKGIIKEILINDGTPVEFDQPIMIIENN